MRAPSVHYIEAPRRRRARPISVSTICRFHGAAPASHGNSQPSALKVCSCRGFIAGHRAGHLRLAPQAAAFAKSRFRKPSPRCRTGTKAASASIFASAAGLLSSIYRRRQVAGHQASLIRGARLKPMMSMMTLPIYFHTPLYALATVASCSTLSIGAPP